MDLSVDSSLLFSVLLFFHCSATICSLISSFCLGFQRLWAVESWVYVFVVLLYVALRVWQWFCCPSLKALHPLCSPLSAYSFVPVKEKLACFHSSSADLVLILYKSHACFHLLQLIFLVIGLFISMFAFHKAKSMISVTPQKWNC